MKRASLAKNRHQKARSISLAKHISTQTCESDALLSHSGNSVNTLKDLFYEKSRNEWSNAKGGATKRLVQTLIVKPRFESTPRRPRIRNENSDTDCELLIENVTPIRVNNRSFRRLDERSGSLGEITNHIRKSACIIPAKICSNPSTKEMLSLDETIFETIANMENAVEVEKSNSGQEVSKLLDSALPEVSVNEHSRDVSPDTGVFPEESRENSALNDTSAGMRKHASKRNEMFRKPPLPVITQKCNVSQVSANRICVTADVHCNDIEDIDIDIDIGGWSDASFMNGMLNNSKFKNKQALNHDKRASANKRPMQVDNTSSSVLSKKSKKIESNITSNERNCSSLNKNKSNADKPAWIEKDNLKKKSSCSLTRIESQLNKNLLITHVDSSKNACEKTCVREGVSSKCGEHIQYENGSDKNSSDISNSSELSVGEKVRRMLVTNAQKPVTSKPKTSDVVAPAIVESFTDLGPFYGLPAEVMTLFKTYKGISKLYEWQEECLNLKAVRERTNLVYALPTSGGKTLVAEVLILRELLCRRKNALFVLPYVSIVQEKVHSLSQFAIDLGFLVEEYAAGKGQYPPKKRRHKQSIYVATIEKAHSLINSLIENKRLSEIGLVIVDELHLLGEGDRGATLECLLSKVVFSVEKIHIVGMSATIGNLEEVAKFLHAEVYLNSFRPVELKEYVKCEDTLLILNNNEEELFSHDRTLNPPYTSPMKKADPDKVCSLVLEVIPEHSCLVFCPSKQNCENVASLFVSMMPGKLLNIKKEERKALARALLSEGKGSMCSVLQRCVPFGVAYHHSGLTGDERRLLEEAYRAGTLCCICCTSTLAAGVNLPAKRVILRAPFVGASFISISQYKQMVGRAGRAGFDVSGESILVCQQRDMHRVRALLSSKMDNATSQLHTSENRGLQSLVLSSIGLGIANCRKDLHKIAASTLLHVQSAKFEVKSNILVDKTVSNLVKAGALRVDSSAGLSKNNNSNGSCASEQGNSTLNITRPAEKNTNVGNGNNGSKSKVKNIDVHRDTVLKVTRIGRAAMKGPIDLSRAAELYRDLMQAQTSLVLLSCLHLLYLVTPYEMMNQIKVDPIIYFRVYSDMSKKDMQTAHVLGVSQACMLKIMKGSKAYNVSEKIVHRFYITLILNNVWNQESVWTVSKKFNVPRGTVQTLMTSASTFASCVMHFCEELQEFWAIKDLLQSFVQRLSHCCSAELLQLMELPAVKTGRARQLYNAGYKTLKDVANANAATLVNSIDHLPKKVANQIIAAAKLLLLAKAENLREEAEEVLEGLFDNTSEK